LAWKSEQSAPFRSTQKLLTGTSRARWPTLDTRSRQLSGQPRPSRSTSGVAGEPSSIADRAYQAVSVRAAVGTSAFASDTSARSSRTSTRRGLKLFGGQVTLRLLRPSARPLEFGMLATTPLVSARPIARDVVTPALRKHRFTFTNMDANSNLAVALPALDLTLAHLSDDEVLAGTRRLVGRSNRLVRVLDPLPPVPARIEPLGPALARAIPADPTWEGFVQSFCPVRELAPGDRPRDWATNANDAVANSVEANDAGAGARPQESRRPGRRNYPRWRRWRG
jgi:hypothetical protein